MAEKAVCSFGWQNIPKNL